MAASDLIRPYAVASTTFPKAPAPSVFPLERKTRSAGRPDSVGQLGGSKINKPTEGAYVWRQRHFTVVLFLVPTQPTSIRFDRKHFLFQVRQD